MKSMGSGFFTRLPQSAVTVICCMFLIGVSSVSSFAAIYTASGSYTYTTGPSGPLAINTTDSNFVCEGGLLGARTETVQSLTATTMTWQSSPVNWTRAGGTAGVITGTWSGTDSVSGSSFTYSFNGDGTLSVTANISQCRVTGLPTINSFTPASGQAGALVTITGSNFSPIFTDNTVLFNGVSATVVDVRASQLFVIVPAGATTGTISITNPGGSVTSSAPFTVTPGTAAATLRWGGVHHRIDSDGIEYDALDVGISSYAPSLAGMTLTVSGPGAPPFSFTFSDADIDRYVHGQLAVYRKYPTPATPLAAGVYTFTLNDGQGHTSHRVDTHVTAAKNLPQVDSATIQMQRKSDGSYRISWAPLNDTQTYYYRLRISRNDTAETNVYDSTRDMLTSVDIPAGILFDNSMYKVKVQAGDSPDNDLSTNRSDSAWKLFCPQLTDYNAGRLLVGFATLWNRFNPPSGAQSTDVILRVSDPAALTAAINADPNALQLLDSTGAHVYTFLSVAPDRSGTDFYHNFSAPSLAPGAYTFRFVVNGITHYAYATLTAPVLFAIPDSTKMQSEYLSNGNIHFSWANLGFSGALYYRVVVNDTSTGSLTQSPLQNQTYADMNVASLLNKQWRVEVYDSDQIYTQRNRSNSDYIPLVPIVYDAARPVINTFRIRNTLNSAGLPSYHFSVSASGSQSTLTEIRITRPLPNGTFFNLMVNGRYSPFYDGYLLEAPGTLLVGYFTVTAINTAGKSATRYMYVPAARALPRVDYKTIYNDLEPNGDMRVSWAPVVSNVPVWYSFWMYAQADQDGDGLSNSVYKLNNVQQSSIVIPAASVPAIPAMAEIAVTDGGNFSVISNISTSVMVGVEAAGLNNYALLLDADGDGFAGNVDTNDANAAVYPFSAGNAGLATAVTGTSPVNLATGVATTGSTVSVSFNKVIDQRTLPAGFTLNNGIAGAVTYDPATRTATFTPSVPLLPGTTYTTTLSQALRDQGGIALSTPYSWSFTASGSLPSLSATIAGEGNVNSDTGSPGIHGVLPGTYSSPYAWNAPVALTSAPHTGWNFAGWSGDGSCVGTISPCNLIMDLQTRSVTATFTVKPNIRSTINTGNLYGTIQSAFDTAITGDELLLQALTFSELPEPVFNRPGVAIKMIGGYDAGFAGNTGTTYISGSLRIKGGTLRVEKIVITP